MINTLSENIAKQIYDTLSMFKYLSEIKAIGEGKIKGLKNEEIDKFFEELIRNNDIGNKIRERELFEMEFLNI